MLSFPISPRSGQSYAAPNGQIYVWDGVKWLGTTISGGTGGTSGVSDYSWSIAADDSTQREILAGETVKLIGAGTITTTSDAEGNITITGTGGSGTTVASTYSWSIAADDSTQREISASETVKFIGAGGITTSSDDEGNITITGTVVSTDWNDITNKPNIAGTYQFFVAADDSTQRLISTDELIKFTGAGGITTASDDEGNITITWNGALNIPNGSTLSIDGGTGTYWAGQSGVAVAGIDKAGVYRTSSSATNSLFTFGANGSGTMSAAVEGSLFIGTAMPSNNGGLNTDYPGWLVVQSGGKFGGDVNTLGKFILDSAANGAIIFGDGTTQTTAWTGPQTFLDGDVTGSVFADDSTLLVDGVSGIVPNSELAKSITQVIDSNATVNTSATITTNNSYTNTVDFSTDVDPGVGYTLDGWYQRNSEQIEFALFGPGSFQTYLTGLALGRTVIVTYSTGSGNQTITRPLTQRFTETGQTDPANPTWGRVSGRIDATLPADQTGIVSINFPVYSTSSKTWTFGTGGSLTFPDDTISTGKGITLPVNESLTVNLPYTAFGGGTRTFKINPQSIKLPNINGVIFAGDETAANEWNLDSGNKLLSFPDAGDGVYPKIFYSDPNNDGTGMELLTFAKSIKITAASNKSWTFGTDGSLTFPDDTVQTTAWTGVVDYNTLTNKPDLAGTYQFSVAADDSTQRVISTDELIKFTGAGGITTSSDLEGNITINYVQGDIRSEGDINIDINLADSTLRRWTFGEDGSFTVPNGISSFENFEIKINADDSTLQTFKFDSAGGITLPNSSQIRPSSATYDAALASWESARQSFELQATDAGITAQGWPFIAWQANGENAAEYLTELTRAWNIQQTPGETLVFVPAISSSLYNQIRSALTTVNSAYLSADNGVSISVQSSDYATLSKYWNFGEDGKLTFPDGAKYAGKTVTMPTTTTGTPNSFVWEFSDQLVGSDNITLNWNLLASNQGGFYFGTTHSTTGKYLFLDGTDQSLSYIAGGVFGGGKLKFGESTNGGAGGVNDIELTSSAGRVRVKTANNSWSFGSQGLLSLGDSSGGIHSNQTTGRITIGDALGPTGTLAAPSTGIMIGGEDYVFEISQYAASFPPVWTFGKDRSLNIPGSITSSSEINIEINLTDSTMRRWSFGEDGILTLPSVGKINNGEYDWTFGTDGSLTLPGDIKSEGNINIDINLADSTLRRWQFGEDGHLIFPGGTNIIESSADSLGIYSNNPTRTNGLEIFGNTETNLFNQSKVRIISNVGTVNRVWEFGTNGSLTFPDATIQTTAYNGTAFPSQTGNTGKYLTTDGSALSWATVAGGGGGGSTLVNGAFEVSLGATGNLTIPGDILSENEINIDLNLADSTLRRWTFGQDGELLTPGNINTTATTFTLANTVATTINIGGAATTLTIANSLSGSTAQSVQIATGTNTGGKTLNIGTGGGSATVNLGTAVGGATNINSSSIQSGAATVSLFTSTSTSISFATAATTLAIGSTAGGAITTLNAPTVIGSATTQNLYNTVATTVNEFGAATAINVATNAASATTWTLGNPNNTNTLTVAGGTAGGTDSISSTVTTGVINVFTGLTTGTLNIATGTSATAINIGGATSTITVGNGLTVRGPLISTATAGITAVEFDTEQLTIIGNRIATTVTNANLELECNGTGGVVINNIAEATTASTARSVGYLGIPASTVSTSATLTIADAGEHVYVTTNSQTITIPANSSVAYPVGTTITFIAGPSATTVTIAITSDTMYLAGAGTTGSRTLAAHGMATAVKVASTTWYINGVGLT
jgi:hypothetical protein